jgi:hypothetical protein
MLRDIYMAFGGVGTFLIAMGMCLTVLSWWLAITGTMMRSMNRWRRAGLLFLVSLVPPASIGVLIAFLINDRRLAVHSGQRAKNRSMTHGPAFTSAETSGSN